MRMANGYAPVYKVQTAGELPRVHRDSPTKESPKR